MATADVASPQDYLTARLSLLEREKEWTRLQDSISKERRALPLVEVTKDYTFVDADSGKNLSLPDLFQGRRQLIVYHAMFDPSWNEACENCTLLLDHIPPLEHLHSHRTTLAVVSLAPAEKIKGYKSQMGLDRFPWYSSNGTSFNADYAVTVTTARPGEKTKDEDVSKNSHTGGAENDMYNFRTSKENIAKNMAFFASGEQPGHSIFVRGGSFESGGVDRGEEGKIYHSYSSYSRAGEILVNTVHWLEMTPMGKQNRNSQNPNGVDYRRRGEYTEEEIGAK